jgi:hypothetical protein
VLVAVLTPAEWRLYYPQLEGTDEDAVLVELIDAADGLVAAYCGFPRTVDGIHTLEQADYLVHLDGPSLVQAAVLCLCVHPISAVTELHADLTRTYDAGTLRTDFALDGERGLLVLDYGAPAWPVGFRAIQIAFTAGYAVTPPALRAIVATVVRHLWDRRNVQGEASYSMGGSSASLTDTDALIPAAAKEALWPYLTSCARARIAAQQAAA